MYVENDGYIQAQLDGMDETGDNASRRPVAH